MLETADAEMKDGAVPLGESECDWAAREAEDHDTLQEDRLRERRDTYCQDNNNSHQWDWIMAHILRFCTLFHFTHNSEVISIS